MAWYPGAIRMELQPESDQQAAIRPTQFIMHSIAAPWTKERTFEYWRDSTNLESHFGQSYDGSIAQYIGTQTRADANYLANRRSDGTGAVSMETASNLQHTDPWTDAQVEGQIGLGVWLHRTHGIPLRICRTASDPGFGYHRLHADWAISGTDCPGDARVRQFHEVVFPGIVARATGTTPPEEDMALTDDDLKRIALAVLGYKGRLASGAQDPRDVYGYIRDTAGDAAPLEGQVKALTAKVDALAAKVAALETTGLTPAQVAAIAKAVNDDAATRLAN